MAGKSSFSVSQADYNGELTSATVNIPDMTILNTEVLLPAIGNYKDSVDAITKGVLTSTNLVFEKSVLAPPRTKATDKDAQRERKWRVFYYDITTNNSFQVEYGCADASLLPAGGLEAVNLRDGQAPAGVWSTFKVNFEALVDTPDGNDAKLLEAVLVGRNS